MGHTEFQQGQREWAERRGICLDARDYVRSENDNFLRPLSDAARRDFSRGSGGELRSHPDRPSKLTALHSSAALAFNAFEYWRAGDTRVLESALGLPARILEFRFEAQFPILAKSEPPNVDVAMELRDGSTWAVESKFTEPYGSAKNLRAAMKDKYFPKGIPLWTARGLPKCGALAAEIRTGDTQFRRIDAAQLLKHVLGLHTCRRTYVLSYMWLASDSEASAQHEREIGVFAQRLVGEVKFVPIRYQDFLARLRRIASSDHDNYFSYMSDRYLSSGAR